jgi:amidohydrolase
MLNRARKIEDQLIAWRRDFHMHPELGFQETRTAGKVAGVLEELGYRVRTGVGRTGVVAELGTGRPVVAIRADMDALPIQDSKNVPYASKNPGVMHACGHDAHTAIALGVATLLKEATFTGMVRFLFQPCEEAEDEEGLSGASRMIEDGAIEGVDYALALHVSSELPVGDVAVLPGLASAGVDTFYATIIGKGGHGAAPHTVIDPIYIATHVMQALYGLISRRIPPMEAGVVSIGSIQGGNKDNVIPDRVEISGTIRYNDEAVQEKLHAEIERAMQIAQTLGGDYELKIVIGFPSIVNDEKVIDLIREVACEILGPSHVQEAERLMGAEDFSFFLQQAPGAMFRLGARIEGEKRLHHNPEFDIDERCLPIGAAILAETALRLLQQGA